MVVTEHDDPTGGNDGDNPTGGNDGSGHRRRTSTRMERLACISFSFQAKIIGTIVSIDGALIVILYKGPLIIFFLPNSLQPLKGSLDSSPSNWVFGGLLIVSSHMLDAVWYIAMANIIKEYPAKLVVVFFNNFFGALVCGSVGFVFGTKPSSWRHKYGDCWQSHGDCWQSHPWTT